MSNVKNGWSDTLRKRFTQDGGWVGMVKFPVPDGYRNAYWTAYQQRWERWEKAAKPEQNHMSFKTLWWGMTGVDPR
jgi:hypothetical protein